MHSRPCVFNTLQGTSKKTWGASVHTALRLCLRNVHKSGPTSPSVNRIDIRDPSLPKYTATRCETRPFLFTAKWAVPANVPIEDGLPCGSDAVLPRQFSFRTSLCGPDWSTQTAPKSADLMPVSAQRVVLDESEKRFLCHLGRWTLGCSAFDRISIQA
jgi:hypothetical protein